MRKLLFCLSLLASAFVYADTTITIPDVPGHPPIPQHSFLGLTVSGYAAASYNYLSQSQFFTSGYFDRLYDVNPNGPILHQIDLTVSRLPQQGFGGLVETILGRDTYALPVYGMEPWLDSQNAGLVLEQVYLQYALHTFTFLVGKFHTLAGYEFVEIPQDPVFSSSLIAAYLEPGTHTGLRVNDAVTDRIILTMGINNGWDNIRDWSRRKTIELGGVYTDEKYSLSAYWYNGQERATPFTSTGPEGIRNLIDLLASINLTSQLKLTANYDYVTQNTAALPNGNLGRVVAQGIAGYLEYQFNSKWRTVLRAEYFQDRNGFETGIPQNIKEMTVTVGYLVMKNFEIRAETRRDVASTNSYQAKNGVSTSNNMQSFAVEGVVTF